MINTIKKSNKRTVSSHKYTFFSQLKRNKPAFFGFIVITIFFLIAIFAPLIAPYPEDALTGSDILKRLIPPCKEHIFGTDDLGRDVFSRVILGSRLSLFAGVVAIFITMCIGIPLGAISGYYGGKVDEVIMRITDIFLAFPYLILAMVIAVILKPGLYSAMTAISLTWWPYYTRLVRGQALSLRKKPFVLAAKMMGASNIRIIFTHILPNCVGPIIVNASLDMGYIILACASLSFIGVGAQAPLAEWGLMINIGRKFFLNAPWLTIFPGVAIFLTVLGFNLLGDGIRDILDPQSKPR
ncbi:MAG: nickel transporter permease [Clostridiaceae bacterium]